MTLRERAIRAIEAMPDEATIDDVIERLYFISKVEQGITEADQGRVVSNQDARQRLARWLE